LYRIDLSNDDPARDLVKGCLEALSARFSDKVVSVDIKNFNAARIWKLYGTNARKGEDTADRPWRRAGLMSVPDPVVLVTRDLLEGLASELKAQKAPPAPIPSSKSPGKKEFDLAEWLAQYEPNIPCKVTPKNKPGHRYFYQLDPCPFSNGAHSDGAYLGQMNDGAVFAKCHHNSCGTGNRWRELRAIAEPGYTDRRNGKADKDVDEAKDEDTARILPFFEKDGRLYLDVIEPGGTFGFVHETNGSIRFDSRVIDGGDVITPAVLPVHHDTRETVFVVGVPRADLVKSAPLLSPAELYTLLDDHINRYCDMPTRDRELAVYYALYTWFYTKAPTSPYLRFLGDTGKGKSRLTEVVSDICIYPIKATGSSTTSGIMRFHERWRGTLVIDEGDLRGGAEDPLVKFLNIGFENGKYIILSDNENPKTQLIFLPYGPKVLAMRVPFKDNATEGRCLSYSPYETYRQDIPPELSPAYHSEVAELRAIITRFVLHHWQEVDGNEMMKYGDLDIERRLLQMARPVSIVLQLFPDGNTRFIEYLKYRQQEIKRTRSESWEGMLFNLAYSLAVGDETIDGVIPEAITAGAISEIFKAKSGTVTKALCSIGFETERERVTIYQKGGSASKKMVRKLVVPSPRTWKEITRRYWYRDDEIKAPDCPDILKGSRWIETQQKITSPNQNEHPNCDTCDTCDTSGEEGGGRNEQEIPTKVGDEDHTPHSASVTPVTSVTNKSDDDHTPRSTSVTPVTSVTPQTFSDLIKQYDLYPDLDLSGHASGK
ncbi:MAG TPA: hypothetical protein PLK38_05280, partial [Methanoregulaceae archaeon]|nr:hypothetical protein [Methanoregulaceae archaeon]